MIARRTEPPAIVAMVATMARRELLLGRALPSIFGQKTACSEVVLIEDGPGLLGSAEIQAMASVHGIAISLLGNRRTPGACGAWNSGIDHLARRAGDPRDVYVAFLDDDDLWMPDHVGNTLALTLDGADVIATPFIRREDDRHDAIVLPPDQLRTDTFKIGNPGIQASNLVIRLDRLLQAGLFDESLHSCTDRDLLIRVSRLRGIRYRTTKSPSAVHCAERDRPRLSTPGSAAREQGLSGFYRKHRHEMTAAQRDAALQRSRALFGWSPPSPTHPGARVEILRGEEAPRGIRLIVGLISDGSRQRSLEGLLADLARLATRPGLDAMEIVLLENGVRPAHAQPLRASADFAASLGLRVRLIDTGMRDASFAAALGAPPGGTWPIAHARTALQSYLHPLAKSQCDAVVWLLDDDMRLSPLLDLGDAVVHSELPWVWRLQQLKRSGVDIAICPYTGAPPLPTLSTMRVQMIDLAATLRSYAHGHSATGVMPSDFSDGNRALRACRRDYYYDLSHIETDRLETPFLFEPASSDETTDAFIGRLMNRIDGILSGRQVFRPLVALAEDINAFRIEERGCHRGGNCFVFAADALVDAINPAPIVEDRATRRSDMIWALVQRHVHGRRVVSVCLPTYHAREQGDAQDERAVSSLIDDIRGFAVYSALDDHYTGRCTDVGQRARKYLEERLAALRLSFHRIDALADEVDALADHPALRQHGMRLKRFACRVASMCSMSTFEIVREACMALSADLVREFVGDLTHRAGAIDAESLDRSIIRRQLDEARYTQARRILLGEINAMSPSATPTTEPCTLGAGQEGVIFRDAHHVYKVFDGWNFRDAHIFAERLDRLARRLECVEQSASIPAYSLMRLRNGQYALRYRHEVTTPYSGGAGHELVGLLASAWRIGVACRNFHPKNIRVSSRGILLTDIGRDLVLDDDAVDYPAEHERMCRRAYLTLRCWDRPVLDSLMRASLERTDLPALTGYPAFLTAVRQAAGAEPRPEPELDIVAALKPRTVLDFGCGKGEYAQTMGGDGRLVVAYDPDPALRARLKTRLEPDVRVASTLDEAASPDGYELVLCRRVLCQIEDQAARGVLAELRSLVSTEGNVVLSVCHPEHAPFMHTAECMPEPSRILPLQAGGRWHKRHRASNRRMVEFWRPERMLRRWIQRAGFDIVERRERDAVDIERFEMGRDLLVLTLRPSRREPTSLLIKSCAMEADRLRDQVVHLIEQLEGPHAFNEVVLSLDSRRHGFPRRYADGDIDALVEQAESLLREGWIDRIVSQAPVEAETRRINRSWLGIDSPCTHADNGAPLHSVFTAFDTIRTRWLLQCDLDVIVARLDFSHDYLQDMQAAARGRDDVVTVAFNIAHKRDMPYTEGPPWRTEARACLLDMEKLRSLRPLVPDAAGMPAWHRALDARIIVSGARSLRGGDHRTYFVHPDNMFKIEDRNSYFAMVDRIAEGDIPDIQYAQVDLRMQPGSWRRHPRSERYVFIIAGRNVRFTRFRRCIESVLTQRSQDWGAIFVDDASDIELSSAYRHLLSAHRERFTIVRNRVRRGLLANTADAIRHHMHDPASVVVLLDADDCLVGTQVLATLERHYSEGADLTVGSLYRSDKHVDYSVTFTDARRRRGGNVWQHLRTFRKGLFDRLPDAALRLDGAYVDLASDWALMLPLTEIATRPVWIEDVLYFHEPGTARDARHRKEREQVIARLVGMPSLARDKA